MPHAAKGHKRYDFGMRTLRGIGFGLGIVALTVGVIAGVVTAVQHIPRPEKKIAWVKRPDSIIVQMKNVGGPYKLGFVDPAPSFTLYGDGTLIVSEVSQACGTVSGSCSEYTLLQSHLSDHDIQELLDFIDGTGFLGFSYEQPVPPVSDAVTTYIYVSTKLAANAVRASALGWEQSGQAWSEFGKLKTIDQRLQDLRNATAQHTTRHEPAEGELDIVPQVANDLTGVPEWPFPQFDISAATSGEGSVGHLRLSSDKLEELRLTDPSTTQCWCPVQQAGRAFNVFYRPVLPYEEHFPEFDTTQ
jgi:hypothetical protein